MTNQSIKITITGETPIDNDLDGSAIKGMAFMIEKLLGPGSIVSVIQIQEERNLFRLDADEQGTVVDFRLAGAA